MPLIILFVSFFLASLTGLVSRRRVLIEFASVAAALIAFVASFSVAVRVATENVYAPSAIFSVDAIGAILLLVIGCVGLATAVYAVAYLRQETEKEVIGFSRVRRFYVLLNIFLAAMFLAVSASSPIFAWIAVEATTLSTAFLISFYNKPSAMEAAWKYLIINSVGLLLGFFGTLLYLTSLRGIGEGGLVTWQSLLANASHLDPFIAKTAFLFVLIGYGTKVGLVPMHTWLPDAHGKAPAPVSALLSGVLLNVALVVILRFRAVTNAVIGPSYAQQMLIVFGILSITIPAFIILTQKNYKRLLAYSSVENMGIMTLGFGFGGVAVMASVLHLVFHSLLKSALFFLSGNFLLKYHSAKIINVKGALRVLPVTSILFLMGFFALTGAPPFGIFLTKIVIFSSGIASHPYVAILGLLLTALVFVGFLKHASSMVFGTPREDVQKEKEQPWLLLSPLALIILVLLLSFYQPPFLATLIRDAALSASL